MIEDWMSVAERESDRAVRRLVHLGVVEPPSLHRVDAGLERMGAGHVGHRESLVRLVPALPSPGSVVPMAGMAALAL